MCGGFCMCGGVSRTGWGHGMKRCAGLVEMGSLCHPHASKWHPMVVSGALRDRPKEPVAPDGEIEEVGGETGEVAGQEPQDVPEDEYTRYTVHGFCKGF